MILEAIAITSIGFNILFLIIFAVLAPFAYRMIKIVLAVEDAVNDCLDILDKRYTSLSQILEKPIFFDSVEVRQAISDISKSRDVVLYIANVLSTSVDPMSVEEAAGDENSIQSAGESN